MQAGEVLFLKRFFMVQQSPMLMTWFLPGLSTMVSSRDLIVKTYSFKTINMLESQRVHILLRNIAMWQSTLLNFLRQNRSKLKEAVKHLK